MRSYPIVLLILAVFAVLLFSAERQPISAQEASCPADIQLAISRAAASCVSLASDTACYGSGQVQTDIRPGFPLVRSFAQIGERLDLNTISVIRTAGDSEVWSAAAVRKHGSFNRSLGRNTTIWLFGETLLANNSPAAPEAEVVTSANALIRARPTEDATVVAQVPVNTFLMANGYSTDAAWVRVFIPNVAAIGWVSARALDRVPFTDLRLVDNPTGGYPIPFQFSFFVSRRDDARCPGAPESGMLVQSPGAREEIYILINNFIISIAGTAFLQAEANGTFNINTISGMVRTTTNLTRSQFDDAYSIIPVGARGEQALNDRALAIAVPITLAPYNLEVISALPLSLLPTRIREVAAPIQPEILATLGLVAPTDIPTPTLTPSDTPTPEPTVTPTTTDVPGMPTRTPAPTHTPTFTFTPSLTFTPITPTLTPSRTLTPTWTPTPTPTIDTTCRREMRISDNTYAGPGTFFEVTGRLSEGAFVLPQQQTTDGRGQVWFQLISGGWIVASSVRQFGVCEPVPEIPLPQPPPTNTVLLETCEPDNGPIRVGQQVTFRFTPPGFFTVGEAIAAVRVDPGQISVDGQALPVQVTDPLQVTRTSVVRTFFSTWQATSGVHRVLGQRLGYSVTCDFTVPNE